LAAGVASKLVVKVGTRPLVVVGAIIGSAGLFVLSRIPVNRPTSPICCPD
jgi:hypothetical protein